MQFAKTAYAEQKILNFLLLGETFTPPATWYLALFTADPGREGLLTSEIADTAYARLPVTFTPAADDLESGSFCESVYDIEFAQATIDWGTVTHVMLMDAATAGNGWYRGALDVSKIIGIGDFCRFPAGHFVIEED